MLCGVHNHILDRKLIDNPVISRFDCEENKIVAKMTINRVLLKNILTTCDAQVQIRTQYPVRVQERNTAF